MAKRKRRGLAGSTFSVWNRRLASTTRVAAPPKKIPGQQPKDAAGIEFIPVTLVGPQSTPVLVQRPGDLNALGAMAMEMVLPSGGVIRLATNCPASFLAAAFAAMAVQ
jgi:hypothetical protein